MALATVAESKMTTLIPFRSRGASMTPNTQANKARQTIRELMARGLTDEPMLIGAAAESIGGDESAKMIATMVWRKFFTVTEPN